MKDNSRDQGSTQAALDAFARGFTAIPLQTKSKRPLSSSWTHTTWDSAEIVTEAFSSFADQGAGNVGILLGRPSSGLIDIDLDHPTALRLRDLLLPNTSMVSGRPGAQRSHMWYRVIDDLPETKQFQLPKQGGAHRGEMIVELRSTGAQTVIPPSVHEGTGELVVWEGEPWGGESGPAVVNGKALSIRVATLALAVTLLDKWPDKGARHEAYLALAGGLLRYPNHDGKLHPFWGRASNVANVIRAIALGSHDRDGAEARVHEAIESTRKKLLANEKAVGFPRLAEFIGNDHAEAARRFAKETAEIAGFEIEAESRSPDSIDAQSVALVSTLPAEDRNPLDERISTWEPVDLDPYLSGKVRQRHPTVLARDDGKCLFYEGLVNLLYGKPEAGKSMVSLAACVQEMIKAKDVVYIDFEDNPEGTIDRLLQLGIGIDDIRKHFHYIRPEEPIAEMLRGYGSESDKAQAAQVIFAESLRRINPSLIIVDGMTVLYGLHNLDSNQNGPTEVIGSWLKKLTRNGRTTVILIDHTPKGAIRGADPIGSGHKVAFVQGASYQVHPITRPVPGRIGELELIINKDRIGSVRKFVLDEIQGDDDKGATPKEILVAAIVVVDSRIDNMIDIRIKRSDPDIEGIAENTELRLEVEKEQRIDLRVLRLFDGDMDKRIKTSEAMAELQLEETEVHAAWTRLQKVQLIQPHSSHRWRYYTLADPNAIQTEKD